MEKKYVLTGITVNFEGRTLHQIKAVRSFGFVKEGDLGGYIEKESNLSHFGNAWVYPDGKVCDFGIVKDNGIVAGNAVVYEHGKVCDSGIVSGNAKVFGYGIIAGNAKLGGDGFINGYGIISGKAEIKTVGEFLCVGPVGADNDYVSFFMTTEGHIDVICGAFFGNLQMFRKGIYNVYGNSVDSEILHHACDMAELMMGRSITAAAEPILLAKKRENKAIA